MTERTAFHRWDRALDWAALLPAGLLLIVGLREYRDGGSVGWPLTAALVFLASLWPVYRGMSRRRSGARRES
ncbi:hypothetical protein ABZZ36_35600 [Actinacidiphila glaucinigra]|uniref:hypothetical protein n=1 Tax=Actinacidiphila glaucinigra TaxID=235986 RepID=UPI00339F70A8